MFKKLLPLIASAAFFIPAPSSAAPMTLSVHDADLRSTITLIGRNGGINVLADDSVKGTISISVANVEPVKILEIISKVKNLRLLYEAGVYILTAQLLPSELMQSYVLPIKFGDAETLRKAIYKILDNEPDKPRVESMKVKDSDGTERTYNYTSNKDNTRLTGDDEKDDPRTKRVFVNSEVNAIVLFGTPTEYKRVKNLLETLDVELKQVSVEAKILAIDKEETKNLGVEWAWSSIDGTYSAQSSRNRYSESSRERSNEFSKELKNTTKDGLENNSSDTNSFSSSSLIQFGRSLTASTGLNWALSAQINALVTDGKAKILSRPNVTTIQGHVATINVGSSVPVPTVQTTNSTVTTSFDYRDAGIILMYTPRINSDGTITATIITEISTPQYVAEMGAYRFNRRTASTTVTVRDGEPMIIGGLIGAEEAKSVSKIPFLGDLPILGALFRNHRKSKSESELVIFLTAHVLGSNSNETLPFEP